MNIAETVLNNVVGTIMVLIGVVGIGLSFAMGGSALALLATVVYMIAGIIIYEGAVWSSSSV